MKYFSEGQVVDSRGNGTPKGLRTLKYIFGCHRPESIVIGGYHRIDACLISYGEAGSAGEAILNFRHLKTRTTTSE